MLFNVIGLVAGSGKIAVHKNGFRAQKMQILGLTPSKYCPRGVFQVPSGFNFAEFHQPNIQEISIDSKAEIKKFNTLYELCQLEEQFLKDNRFVSFVEEEIPSSPEEEQLEKEQDKIATELLLSLRNKN